MSRAASLSRTAQVWISDGLPASALQEFLAAEAPESWQRLPLLGGVTVWPPSTEKVKLVIACPNRLGAYESLPPRRRWEKVWWWSDPLDAGQSSYGSVAGVRRVVAPVSLPAGRSLSEAGQRSRRAADYLARRIRQIRGVRIPRIPHGRRFPVLLPVAPAPVLEGVAEEILFTRPVDGWPGLVICEGNWWQSAARLEAVVEAVARASRGERPPSLAGAERMWSSTGP